MPSSWQRSINKGAVNFYVGTTDPHRTISGTRGTPTSVRRQGRRIRRGRRGRLLCGSPGPGRRRFAPSLRRRHGLCQQPESAAGRAPLHLGPTKGRSAGPPGPGHQSRLQCSGHPIVLFAGKCRPGGPVSIRLCGRLHRHRSRQTGADSALHPAEHSNHQRYGHRQQAGPHPAPGIRHQ